MRALASGPQISNQDLPYRKRKGTGDGWGMLRSKEEKVNERTIWPEPLGLSTTRARGVVAL